MALTNRSGIKLRSTFLAPGPACNYGCKRRRKEYAFHRCVQVFLTQSQSLERILYVWAIRHPASGYVQGINDLATPFFQVFLSAYIGTFVSMLMYAQTR